MIQLVYQLRIDSVVANSPHFESFDPAWNENLEESILRMELSASWILTRREIFAIFWKTKCLPVQSKWKRSRLLLQWDQNAHLIKKGLTWQIDFLQCFFSEIDDNGVQKHDDEINFKIRRQFINTSVCHALTLIMLIDFGWSKLPWLNSINYMWCVHKECLCLVAKTEPSINLEQTTPISRAPVQKVLIWSVSLTRRRILWSFLSCIPLLSCLRHFFFWNKDCENND